LVKPFLSIVIPAYNEERRLPKTLEQVMAFITSQNYPAEVLVVENGSTDHTLAVGQSFAERHPQIRLIHNPERGKGLAVKRGMLEAHGDFRFMCDADLSMPIQEVKRFLPPQLDEYDIAIASREAPGAVRYNEPYYRHFIGRGYNLLIRWLALPGLHDTQCGFKCFRGEVAEDLFTRQTFSGWSFDVEVLFIGRVRGYKIVELPIPWYYNAESKIKVLGDSFNMGRDLIKMRLNALRGVYG
jgi:glycosyltransferase involved in cell wall biosynthesis